MSDLKLAFNPIQGSESVILNQAYCEGAVYFATDTKRIFMDANNIAKMPMGGNSGVYYGKMILQETPDENQKEFEFSVYDLEINSEDSDSINIPNTNDLILNIPDGCFYRVTDISEGKEIIITTEKLTIAGNGGGNSTSGPSLSGVVFNRITEQNIYTLAGIPCILDFVVTATDTGGELTENGTYRLTVDGIEKARGTIINNDPNNSHDYNSIDVSQYLHTDSNVVKIYASMDVGGTSNVEVSKSWNINVSSVELKWTPSFTTPNYINEEFKLEWEIVGGSGIKKITHIIIDGQDYPKETTTAGEQDKTFNPIQLGLAHGIHKFELYVEAFVGGNSKPTNKIVKNLMFVDPTNDNYIINYDYYGDSMKQYDTIQIPVTIYGKGNSGATVRFSVNDSEKAVKEQFLNGQIYNFSYTAIGVGPQVLAFSCGQTEESFLINVESLGFKIEEEEDYAFKFKASDFSDNGSVQKWNSNGITASFNDFDWINGGLKTEIDEFNNSRQYVCVKAGSNIEIDYNVFGSGAKGKGKCLKIIFKTVKCKDYNARALTCHDGQRGFIMNANGAEFNSMLTKCDVFYCEDSYIELELDITNFDKDNPKKSYIRTWVDGTPFNLRVYSSSDEFSTQEGTKLVIGSNDCDVQIYLIKLYERTLTDDEHLNNFIADAPNSTEMISRYTRNNIIYTEGKYEGEISPTLLAKANPNCLVHSYTIDKMTIAKDKPVEKCSYVQYHGRGDKPSLQAKNVTIKVQGTSSAAYGLAAYNIDSDFTEGFEDENGNHIDGWSMNSNSIPVDYFCTKVNVASVENANNALNQEWYNRYQPYQSVLKGRNRTDGKSHRDCMEFTPGVLFIEDLNPITDIKGGIGNNVFKENTKYCATTNADGSKLTSAWPKMYAVCNMGNSKDNVEVFHDKDNPKECCIEVADNQQPGQWMVVPQGIYYDKETGNAEYINILSIDDGATTVCPDGETRSNFSMWVDGMDKIYKFRYPKKAIKKFKAEDTDQATKDKIRTMIINWFNFVMWMSQNNPSEKYMTKQFEEHYEKVIYNNADDFNAEVLKKYILTNDEYVEVDAYIKENTEYYIFLTEEESFKRYPGSIFTLSNNNAEDKAKHLGSHIEVIDRTAYDREITYYVCTEHLYGATNEPLPSSVTFEGKTFEGYKVKDPELRRYQEGYAPILEGFTENAYAGTYHYDTTNYRIAKMLEDCEDHLCMESVVFHYLFIERHCMIDNVAKNTFWTTEDGVGWNLTKNYDNDTSDGNDNQGKLTLTYGLEPGDTDISGTSIFNAGNSVWLNFIRRLYSTCQKVYKKLDEQDAWSANAYLKIFKEWQSAIPERCWIEDFYRKYIRPYEIYNDTMFIEMGEGGKKTHQRKQFETYQESYISSKYVGQVCGMNYFILRLNGNNFGDGFVVPVTLYADCYVQGAFGSDGMTTPNVRIRGKKNEVIELRSPISNATDATAYLYPSNLYQSLGNEESGLNALQLKQYSVNNANKLRTLALGVDGQTINKSLESVSLGACENLENLYIAGLEGCTENALNLENCASIKKIDARNSGFPSIEIPSGAPLESLQVHTPRSIKLANLNKLNQLTFHENDQGEILSLMKIDVDNIDNNIVNTKTNIIDKAPCLESIRALNVQWSIDDISELNLSTKEINILKKISDTTFRNELEEIIPKQNTLSGVLTVKEDDKIDNSVAIQIYDNYINRDNYPNLDIVFKGSAYLPKVTVLNGNGEVCWSRRIANKGTITSDFLAGGPNGPFIFANATTQQDTIGETYTFTGFWKIYLKDKDGSFNVKSEMKLDDLIKYTDQITTDIIFEPQFTAETRTYTLNFYTYNEDTGKVDKLIKTVEEAPYNTSLNLYYPGETPYKPDEPNYRLKETNHFIGYGLSQEALTPVKNDSKVSKNQNFYAIFEKASDVTEIVHPEWFDFTEYSYNEAGPYEVSRLIPTNYLPQGKRLDAVQGYSVSIKSDLVLKGKITIPATYNGLPVVKISDSFATGEKGQEITHIFFEKDNQMYEIGSSAFENNNKLMYFDFSATKVRQIRGYAFLNCQKLNPACFTFNNAQLFYVGQGGFSGCFNNSGTPVTLKIPGSICVLCQFAFTYLNVPEESLMEIGSETDPLDFLIAPEFGYDGSLASVNYFGQNKDGTFKLITLFSPYASLESKVKDKNGNDIEGIQVIHIFGDVPKSDLENK